MRGDGGGNCELHCASGGGVHAYAYPPGGGCGGGGDDDDDGGYDESFI